MASGQGSDWLIESSTTYLRQCSNYDDDRVRKYSLSVDRCTRVLMLVLAKIVVLLSYCHWICKLATAIDEKYFFLNIFGSIYDIISNEAFNHVLMGNV